METRIAVIGAGVAGLCAVKQLSKISNISVTVYEQTEHFGGTWKYCDKTGFDEYGLLIRSAMYKNLRTNLPKETMEFLSFPFKHEESFVSRIAVFEYITGFVDAFGLKKYIKFLHHVLNVAREDKTWMISIKNLQNNKIEVSSFDAVLVCNGHYSDPRYPKLIGMEKYKRLQMHSHQYRNPECYKGLVVVIVGSGPSGVDITFDIATNAKKVFFSHHNVKLKRKNFPINVVHKSDIKELTENAVVFEDGTYEEADIIIYCTGYDYSFPFLSEECDVKITDNFVQPLYKHIININHPTMWFIGIPWQTLIFPLFELQVRCFISFILGKVSLPSTKDMLLDLENDIQERKKAGQKMRYFHRMGNNSKCYTTQLAETFKVEPIPEIVHNIYESAKARREEDLSNYREDVYEMIDSGHYELHKNKLK